MLDRALLEHKTALFEVAFDVPVRLFGELAGARKTFGHDAAKVHRLHEQQAEVLPFGEVLGAERRSNVDDAGAVFERDIVRGDDLPPAVGLGAPGVPLFVIWRRPSPSNQPNSWPNSSGL
ncbi:hypothetical protein [Candidatus Amarobacter glycogenicus]|uniref:hypothetical protein n=1 Tax=Candidatus Amarobacter glycogenicus TaxID=3140699 RepID=UPI0031CCBB64